MSLYRQGAFNHAGGSGGRGPGLVVPRTTRDDGDGGPDDGSQGATMGGGGGGGGGSMVSGPPSREATGAATSPSALARLARRDNRAFGQAALASLDELQCTMPRVTFC